MLEHAIKGNKWYWGWLIVLLAGIGGAFLLWQWQLRVGLSITGLSRDVSWGFYIANMTYLVGIAAGGVMVVLPYYLHDFKAYGRITILGEFLAIGALIMCLTFLFVDLGQPMRAFNIFLYPTPNSVMLYDAFVLTTYLLINLVVGWNVLEAERNGVHYQKWLKPIIYFSIPFAASIHTVTAFLYCGLPGRGFWLTAILAPRFLASAFAAGPSLLILLALLVRKVTNFDPGAKQIQAMGKTVAYAICINVFFFLCEIFVAFYSNIPEHMDHIKYLFFGLHGHTALVPWMWTSMGLMAVGIVLTVVPATRKNDVSLGIAAAAIILGTWIDKGMGMIAGGYVPNPLHEVHEYMPTLPEVAISFGVYALGALIITILYKIVAGVKEETYA